MKASSLGVRHSHSIRALTPLITASRKPPPLPQKNENALPHIVNVDGGKLSTRRYKTSSIYRTTLTIGGIGLKLQSCNFLLTSTVQGNIRMIWEIGIVTQLWRVDRVRVGKPRQGQVVSCSRLCLTTILQVTVPLSVSLELYLKLW